MQTFKPTKSSRALRELFKQSKDYRPSIKAFGEFLKTICVFCEKNPKATGERICEKCIADIPF